MYMELSGKEKRRKSLYFAVFLYIILSKYVENEGDQA